MWTDKKGIYFSSGSNQYSLAMLPEEFRYKVGGVWSTRSINALLQKKGDVWAEISTSDLPAGVNYICKEV